MLKPCDQPGDPRKAGAAIATALDVGDTPRRLVLGEDAVGGVRNKLGRLGDELSRWEKSGREIALTADRPVNEAVVRSDGFACVLFVPLIR